MHAGRGNRVVPVDHHIESSRPALPPPPRRAGGPRVVPVDHHVGSSRVGGPRVAFVPPPAAPPKRSAPHNKDAVTVTDSSESFDEFAAARPMPQSALPQTKRASLDDLSLPGGVHESIPFDASLGVAASGRSDDVAASGTSASVSLPQAKGPRKPLTEGYSPDAPVSTERISGAGVWPTPPSSPRRPVRVLDEAPVATERVPVGKIPPRRALPVRDEGGVGLEDVPVSLLRVESDGISTGSGLRGVRGLRLRTQKEDASSAAVPVSSTPSKDAAWLAAHPVLEYKTLGIKRSTADRDKQLKIAQKKFADLTFNQRRNQIQIAALKDELASLGEREAQTPKGQAKFTLLGKLMMTKNRLKELEGNLKEYPASLASAKLAVDVLSREQASRVAAQRDAREKWQSENPELVRKGFMGKRTRDRAEQAKMLRQEITRLKDMKESEALYLVKMRSLADQENILRRTDGVRGKLQNARTALRKRGFGVDPTSEVERFKPHQEVIQAQIDEHQKSLNQIETKAASAAAEATGFSGI